jgi:CRISPR-associated endonuclease/helicase Cas3
MRLVRTIDIKPDADEAEDEESPGKRYWHWLELLPGGDTDGSKASKKPVLWQVHTDDVVKNTVAIGGKLLVQELQEAFRIAAVCHDLGKRRKLFQTVLGNPNYPAVEWAKSAGKKAGRIEERYRHEFGSLLDIQSKDDFRNLADDLKDLVLHLIAAHHGRGRPHFPTDEAFDPAPPNGIRSDDITREVPRRFARLQRKYGRWGLAYLESLLRAADYAASANPSAFAEDQP